MKRSTLIRVGAASLLAALVLMPGHRMEVQAQKILPRDSSSLPNRNTTPFTPKFEALAETRLLMEGMAHPNYRSLDKLLSEKPADTETWVFARGQALLLAESGNLLLLRPPRNTGRDTWMKLSMAMRDEAGELARKVAARNHPASKVAMVNVANSCNRCHQTFRVQVRVAPEAKKDGNKQPERKEKDDTDAE